MDKRTPDGGTSLWRHELSGAGLDESVGVSVDARGHVYVAATEQTADEGRNLSLRKFTP